MKKGIIYFHDSSKLEYDESYVTYSEHGINFVAVEGCIFVPYSSIKFITEDNIHENK